MAWRLVLLLLIFLLRITSGAPADSIETSPPCTPLRSVPPECAHLLLNSDAGPEEHEQYKKRMARRGALYNISIPDGTLFQTGLMDTDGLGNALSPYWFARALARFAGLSYRMLPNPSIPNDGVKTGDWFKSKHFLRHLPTHVPAPACPNLSALKRACQECHFHCLTYPHASTVSWPYMRDSVRVDTKAAFAAWSLENKYQRPVFEPGDVVIQDRCDGATLLNNLNYGPIAFSFYDSLAQHDNVSSVYVIRDPNLAGRWPQASDRPFYPCRAMHEVLCARLATLSPSAMIHSVGYTSAGVVDDWARALYAPTLYKGVSTLTFWAGMANGGTVYSTPLFVANPPAGVVVDPKPDLGPNWHWVDAPVLNAATAAAQPGPKLQPQHLERIIPWLMLN